MDSAAVNREIRAEIRPLLKDVGFVAFTSRTAWRYHTDRVDVVNFQSFNSYNAGVMGITTYSFAVNLGCYLRYIPNQYADTPGSAALEELPRPKEYECHMRGRLSRSYLGESCSDRQIWFIDERGSNVTKALHDVRMLLVRDGVPWFTQFSSPELVYAILVSNEEQMNSLWGFGRTGSPIRRYFLGYAARAAGLHSEARVNLNSAAETPSFAKIAQRLREDAQSVV
jgi:hypothetical protein